MSNGNNNGVCGKESAVGGGSGGGGGGGGNAPAQTFAPKKISYRVRRTAAD